MGVFGGAFDPPHQAHVALALAAIEQLKLDVLKIVPTGDAWHKERVLSDPVHRLTMSELAFSGLPQVEVDDQELQRTGPSFTIDTLEALKTGRSDSQLYLLIGEDQFAAFRHWHRWRDILQIAIICIAARAHSERAQAQIDDKEMAAGSFLRLNLPLMSLSATKIRQQIASGKHTLQELTQLVPPAVARYISLHRLYSAS